MPRSYYAASHLNERYADSGRSARQIHVFASRAARDQFVADSPTSSHAVNTTRIEIRASKLTRAERERADFQSAD